MNIGKGILLVLGIVGLVLLVLFAPQAAQYLGIALMVIGGILTVIGLFGMEALTVVGFTLIALGLALFLFSGGKFPS